MTWTAANNEALASDLHSFALECWRLYERAKRIDAKWNSNAVSTEMAALSEPVAMEKADMINVIVLAQQIAGLIENAPVTKGDYRTNLFKAIRTSSL